MKPSFILVVGHPKRRASKFPSVRWIYYPQSSGVSLKVARRDAIWDGLLSYLGDRQLDDLAEDKDEGENEIDEQDDGDEDE